MRILKGILRRLLRIFKLIMRPIETNFKEDFFKEEVVEKYFSL